MTFTPDEHLKEERRITMGMRKYKRSIAKARMEAMGIEKANRKMGKVPPGKKQAMWRLVLNGSLARGALRAQLANRKMK